MAGTFPYQFVFWSAIAALLGDRNSVKSPLEPKIKIESKFIEDYNLNRLGWDPQLHWGHEGYPRTCVLNDMAAFEYSLANPDQPKSTHCRSEIYYEYNFSHKTAPRAPIRLHEGRDIITLRAYVNQCGCKTYAAPNGELNKRLLLTNSTFAIVKKLHVHNYYHLQWNKEKKMFELDGYYEFDPAYADRHIQLERVEEEESQESTWIP